MMYKITGKYNESYLEEGITLLKYSSQDRINNIKAYTLFCLVYMALVLFNYVRGNSISLFISSLGLACFLLLIIQILEIYLFKAKTKKHLITRINRYKDNPIAVRELSFSEESVKYCEPEMILELKWSAFSHYEEYRNYIYFFLKESKTPALSLNKENIQDSIKMEIMELIDSKISKEN